MKLHKLAVARLAVAWVALFLAVSAHALEVGQKAPDFLGAWGCNACHDEVDGRTRYLERDFVKLAFYEGVIRTQNVLIREGKVRW